MTDDLFPEFETRRFQTFGAEIHARVGGSGPPLLLLHGFPQTHAMWHKVAPQLAAHFTLVVPDLRGYGASSCPPNDADNFTYSKRAMAQDMVQVMESLGKTVFAVAGHDRGGRVAYRMALDTPERVDRLAVLDIVPTHAMWHDFSMKKAMTIYHWLFLAQPSPLPEMLINSVAADYQGYTLASWTNSRDLSPFDPRALAAYKEAFAGDHIAAACNDYRSGQTYDLGADEADYDAGRKITCPMLALWGDAGIPDETGEPLEIWQRWATNVRGTAVRSGHFLPEENPDATVKALLSFLTEETRR